MIVQIPALPKKTITTRVLFGVGHEVEVSFTFPEGQAMLAYEAIYGLADPRSMREFLKANEDDESVKEYLIRTGAVLDGAFEPVPDEIVFDNEDEDEEEEERNADQELHN